MTPRTLGAIAAVVILTGCSSSDGTPAPTSQPEARTLADTCPLLEAATPTGMMPSEERLAAYAVRLQELADQGDTETVNAIAVMQDAVTGLQRAEPGADYADAYAGMTEALQTLADRCSAVGSSAFQ